MPLISWLAFVVVCGRFNSALLSNYKIAPGATFIRQEFSHGEQLYQENVILSKKKFIPLAKNVIFQQYKYFYVVDRCIKVKINNQEKYI